MSRMLMALSPGLGPMKRLTNNQTLTFLTKNQAGNLKLLISTVGKQCVFWRQIKMMLILFRLQ
jgi:hypothetical protein